MFIISDTTEINAVMWTFANNRNSTGRAYTISTQSKYYLAHRQHVAEDLIMSDSVPDILGDTCNKLWDGFLLDLSVQ